MEFRVFFLEEMFSGLWLESGVVFSGSGFIFFRASSFVLFAFIVFVF